jgi:hypothetical protein
MPVRSHFARTRLMRTDRYRRVRREGWCSRVIEHLIKWQSEAETLDEQDHYKFCRRVVSMALDDWPDPFVAAFYYHYGRHPSKLIPEWLQRDVYAKTLGPSLADLMNNPIPDYDPTSSLPPRGWRASPELLELLDTSRVKGRPAVPPYRHIVDRIPTFAKGCLVYYTERLECGHSHIEYPGGNPGIKRRCPDCLSGPAEDGSVSTVLLRSCSGLGRLSKRA